MDVTKCSFTFWHPCDLVSHQCHPKWYGSENLPRDYHHDAQFGRSQSVHSLHKKAYIMNVRHRQLHGWMNNDHYSPIQLSWLNTKVTYQRPYMTWLLWNKLHRPWDHSNFRHIFRWHEQWTSHISKTVVSKPERGCSHSVAHRTWDKPGSVFHHWCCNLFPSLCML